MLRVWGCRQHHRNLGVGPPTTTDMGYHLKRRLLPRPAHEEHRAAETGLAALARTVKCFYGCPYICYCMRQPYM